MPGDKSSKAAPLSPRGCLCLLFGSFLSPPPHQSQGTAGAHLGHLLQALRGILLCKCGQSEASVAALLPTGPTGAVCSPAWGPKSLQGMGPGGHVGPSGREGWQALFPGAHPSLKAGFTGKGPAFTANQHLLVGPSWLPKALSLVSASSAGLWSAPGLLGRLQSIPSGSPE